MKKTRIHQAGKYCAGPNCDCGYGKTKSNPAPFKIIFNGKKWEIISAGGAIVALVDEQQYHNARALVDAYNIKSALIENEYIQKYIKKIQESKSLETLESIIDKIYADGFEDGQQFSEGVQEGGA